MTDLEIYIKTYFGITEENMDKVASLFELTVLKKGDYYTKVGRFCDKMSFVREGYIRIYADSGDQEVTQWISSKGYFITDLASFIFKDRARWNMQALCDCELYTIDQEHYQKLIDIVPEWLEIEKRFIAGCFITLESRVFSHLSLTTEERYDKLFEENKEIFNQVPLQYLASMLGMKPETLSRIRKKKLDISQV